MSRVYVVGGLKGGVGKTTTAVFLSLALGRLGHRTALVDADPVSQSARSWCRDAHRAGTPMPFDHYTMPYASLAEDVTEAVLPGRDRVVIDTGAADVNILRAACSLAHTVLLVSGPTRGELKRVAPTLATARILAAETGRHVQAAVLITKAQRSSRLADDARTALREAGIPEFTTRIADEMLYRDADGRRPANLAGYTVLAHELENTP